MRRTYKLMEVEKSTKAFIPALDIVEEFDCDEDGHETQTNVLYKHHTTSGRLGMMVMLSCVAESGNNPIQELLEFEESGVWEVMGLRLVQ